MAVSEVVQKRKNVGFMKKRLLIKKKVVLLHPLSRTKLREKVYVGTSSTFFY